MTNSQLVGELRVFGQRFIREIGALPDTRAFCLSPSADFLHMRTRVSEMAYSDTPCAIE